MSSVGRGRRGGGSVPGPAVAVAVRDRPERFMCPCGGGLVGGSTRRKLLVARESLRWDHRPLGERGRLVPSYTHSDRYGQTCRTTTQYRVL